MNIILGQSFSTRSVIPQLVIVTPTRFLDFNTRTYKEKNLEDVPSRVCTLKKKKKIKCFHWHNWEATTTNLFSLRQRKYVKMETLVPLHYSGTWQDWKVSEGFPLHLHMVILNHRITGTGGFIRCPLPLHGMTWLCFGNF